METLQQKYRAGRRGGLVPFNDASENETTRTLAVYSSKGVSTLDSR